MDASSGSKPMLRLHDCDGMTWEEFMNQDPDRADIHYKEREDTVERGFFNHNSVQVFTRGGDSTDSEMGYPIPLRSYVYNRPPDQEGVAYVDGVPY
jgi:hypothetical protein